MIIVIVGPTGVGKTKLSIELAKKLNGEVINADSTIVYKHLDIATAKPTKEEMENIPHHLIDIKELNENYTVYDYQKDAREKINEIIKRGHVPIMVGGTGLYIKATLYDYQFDETKTVNQYEDIDTNALYDKLIKLDSNTEIHPNNRKRIIRALNYIEDTNKKFSEKERTDKLLYDTFIIGLTTDRKTLYERIDSRVDKMFNDGLLEEAKKIYGLKLTSKAVMTPIGYKELFPYFSGEITKQDAINKIKQNSRKYAKRQYTWFNHQLPVKWYDVDFQDFEKTINHIYSDIKKD